MMEAKDIKKAIKKHGAERNVSYDDKYFTHNMPEFMCIAEISFKAGYDKRDSEFVYNPDYLDYQKGVKSGKIVGKQIGRREVVEWQEKNLELFWRSVSTTKHDYYIPLSLADTWQIQKKDWGL